MSTITLAQVKDAGEMSDVYVVTEGEYEDYHIVAIFSTLEKAEAFTDRFNSEYDIESFELDPVKQEIEDYGCTRLKTIRILPTPEITTEQRVRFGILCALEVCTEPGFVSWARRWLSGEDRSAKAEIEKG